MPVVTGDFGPAPPGVDISETQDASMLGAGISLMVIATLTVLLRLFIRVRTKNTHMTIDDYLIIAALVFSYGLDICVILGPKNGNGRHLQTITHEEFTTIWKLLFSHVIIYTFCVTCTKISIVLFYRRIFMLQYSLYVVMFFIICWFLLVIIIACVACRPLPYFWKQYSGQTMNGSCINVPSFFLGNGIVAIFIDFMILFTPIPIIWKLKMPRYQRLAVIGILLLGGFVCIAGVVRIVYLVKNTNSSDPIWTVAPVFIWSCIEPSIGIVSACLPTFAPLFRRCWDAVVSRSGNSDYVGSYLPSHELTNASKNRKSRPTNTEDWERLGNETETTKTDCHSTSELMHSDKNGTAGDNFGIRVENEVTVTYTG